MAIAISAVCSQGQDRKEHIEPDGFKWQEVKKGNLHGAETPEGNTIVPTEFSLVAYHANNGYFRGTAEDYVAVFEPDGRCVIGTDRKYNEVYKHKQRNGEAYYTVYRKEGDKKFTGICDSRGKEIISPDRGYETISLQNGGEKRWYAVSRDNKTGACDSRGKEIIAPEYENLTYYENSFHSLKDNEWSTLNVSIDDTDDSD